MRRRRAARLLLGLVATAALTSCQPTRAPSAPSPGEFEQDDWPAYDYPAAAARGTPVFGLDPTRSRVEVIVGRAGPLARFGHEHVIEIEGLEGWLAFGEFPSSARADLRFPVSGLRVDPAEARQRRGMDDSMTPEDIEGTRENLMLHVLDPRQWPVASLSLRDFRAQGERLSAQLTLSVNGGRHSMVVPFDLRVADDAVIVQGRFALNHGDLGLEPYSALGGGLRVAETLEIEFTLRGLAVPAPD